jgi:hypothetical protein
MKVNRRSMSSAALLALVAGIVLASSPISLAAAKAGAPPYCVLTGGRWGPGSVPQICRFFDYQACVEAAVVLRGNCVVNIDYRGELPARAPVPAANRRR